MADTQNYLIFLDDGGVLNNNQIRGKKWKQLIADWFVPRYGGSPEDWKKANELAMTLEIEAYNRTEEIDEGLDYNKFRKVNDELWLRTMFEFVGISSPPEDQIQPVVKDSLKWIIPQANAPYAGIVDVVVKLAENYGPLYTASNEDSFVLDLYLKGMGIRKYFHTLFGPDLVNWLKPHVGYYESIFKKIGIKSGQAIIVEDRPKCIKSIEKVGAIPIQSRLSNNYDPMTNYVMDESEQLPGIIQSIVAKNE